MKSVGRSALKENAYFYCLYIKVIPALRDLFIMQLSFTRVKEMIDKKNAIYFSQHEQNLQTLTEIPKIEAFLLKLGAFNSRDELNTLIS